MNIATVDTPLSTAALAAAAKTPQPTREQLDPAPLAPLAPQSIDLKGPTAASVEPLAALFPAQAAEDFRMRWDAVQNGFVDDPKQAVRQADELVAQVMKNLAATFAAERSKIEDESSDASGATTENLRVALRHYRSFFQRLLSL